MVLAIAVLLMCLLFVIVFQLKEQSVMARLRESELLDALAVLKNEMTTSESAVSLAENQLRGTFKDSVFYETDQVRLSC